MNHRVQIGQHGVGGNNESWYSLEYSDSKDEFYYVHEWNNMNYSLQIDSGERRIHLKQAVGERFYSEALQIANEARIK